MQRRCRLASATYSACCVSSVTCSDFVVGVAVMKGARFGGLLKPLGFHCWLCFRDGFDAEDCGIAQLFSFRKSRPGFPDSRWMIL